MENRNYIFIIFLFIILAYYVNIVIADNAGSDTSNEFTIEDTTLEANAWVTYAATDLGTFKTGVKGIISLNDVNIPDPPLFPTGLYTGIWTHIAIAKDEYSVDAGYMVEVGIRKLKYSTVIWTPIGFVPVIEEERGVFITYYDVNEDLKKTIIIEGQAELGKYYYVKITKIGSNVWVIGIWCPYNDKMYSYILKSKDTYTTYYAFSQLEYYHYAGDSHIPEEPGETLNTNYDLEWEASNGYHDYNGMAVVHNFDNVEAIWTSDFYLSRISD